MQNINYEEHIRKNIRVTFKDKIKINFLLECRELIKKKTTNYAAILKYYRNDYLTTDLIELDVCNHIIGIHNFNTIFEDEYQKSIKQKDKKYQDNLVNDVLTQIQLRYLNTIVFNRVKVYGKENYLYYPPVYDLFVLINYLDKTRKERLINIKDPKEDYLINLIYGILRKSISIMGVIDYDILDSAFPIARSIVEIYIAYLILKYTKCDFTEYDNFNIYKVYYESNKKYPLEFIEKYEKFKINNNINIKDFLNYGWVNAVVEYHYLEKNNFKLKSLTKLVDKLMYKNKKLEKYGEKLYCFYNSCHIYTHGNILVHKYPIYNLLFIVETLGTILLDIAEDIDNTYKLEFYNGINLIEHTRKHFIQTLDKFENVDDEILKEYYRSKKNLESIYRN